MEIYVLFTKNIHIFDLAKTYPNQTFKLRLRRLCAVNNYIKKKFTGGKHDKGRAEKDDSDKNGAKSNL